MNLLRGKTQEPIASGATGAVYLFRGGSTYSAQVKNDISDLPAWSYVWVAVKNQEFFITAHREQPKPIFGGFIKQEAEHASDT